MKICTFRLTSGMDIRNEIVLDLRKGNPLLKYAYLGRGAKKYDYVINSRNYHTFRNEIEIIHKNLSDIKSRIKGRVIILGVGNGQKLVKLVDKKKEIILIDLSNRLLEKTISAINGKVETVRACFESMNMRTYGKNITFMIFGGTLGNLKDYTTFLKKLKRECPNSNAFIGMEFGAKDDFTGLKNRILKEYGSSEAFDFVFHPLKNIGFKREDGEIQLVFDKEIKRMEKYFIFNNKSKDKRKLLGIEGIEKACLALSHKPSRFEFYQKIVSNGIKLGPFICDAGQNSIVEVYWGKDA